MSRSNVQRSETSGVQRDQQNLIAWEALAEPSRVFAHPDEVLAAPNLTKEEKRAVLASWASDAWAVESAPALRHCPGLLGRYVPLDDVLDALRSLDPEPAAPNRPTGSRSPQGRSLRVRWLSAPAPRLL